MKVRQGDQIECAELSFWLDPKLQARLDHERKGERAEARSRDMSDAAVAPAPTPRTERGDFEKRVNNVKTYAKRMAFLHIISRFSGICALTWATAVLLGGFASSLTTPNFFIISIIILSEAIRLFIIHTITNSLSADQFRESPDPYEFKFEDTQEARTNLLDIICQVLSSFISLGTWLCTVLWFFQYRSTGHDTAGISPAAAATKDANSDNLPKALYTFYALACVNSVAALVSVGLRFFARRKCDVPGQNCLMCFQDEVFRTAIAVGLPDGDRVEILEFAFTKLASDFRRNIRPQIIYKQNKDLIRYLYLNQQGVAMVCEVLKSSLDVWHQTVAANLPGFWVDEDRIGKQVALFWTLGERMHGAGKDAEGALNSIGHLARSFAKANLRHHPFLLEDPAIEAGRSCIVSRLVRLVCKRVRPTMLFQIRALEACCQSSEVVRYLCGERTPRDGNNTGGKRAGEVDSEEMRQLSSALDGALKTGATIHAVSVLVRLRQGIDNEQKRERCKEQVRAFIALAEKGGADKPYVWENEVLMVEWLVNELNMTSDYDEEQDGGGHPHEGITIRSNKTGDKIKYPGRNPRIWRTPRRAAAS